MSKHVKIGVFIPNGAQTLDTACVDILGVMSKQFLATIPFVAEHVRALAPDVTISYITTPTQGCDIKLTSGMVIKATHDYTEAEVAPGKLDIVVVPGPDLDVIVEAGAQEWLREQSKAPGVDVLCICTGILICGVAGIADGKQAAGPNGLQNMLHEKFPRINLVGKTHRWVQDGNFWSSGGITNGNDLMAAYARASSKYWPPAIVEIGLGLTEIADRPQLYAGSSGQGGSVSS